LFSGFSSPLSTNVLQFCVRVIHHAVRKKVQFYAQSYSIYSNRHY